MAEVDDTGAVTVEGHAVGRIEGFRFRADTGGSPEETRTVRQAAQAALGPQFHLRADRFYNAPDTEIDVTDQGGLMWGEHAVGRLAKGAVPMTPEVVAFVDEEAGEQVQQKVLRRLQHFVDRRITAAMAPLAALTGDETLTGLARGFAYRMGEAFGVLPRAEVAQEVKALDPEARTALRKHGVRIGQFTIFLPLLLKPHPTRMRLLLWSLWSGLDEFPSAPPPGVVTVPVKGDEPAGFWPMAGYRAAGERAIRIDMLERLADQIRDKDSRAGFEAAPEMLSITGLSLDAFAALMSGLGYHAEKGERPKMRAAKPARPAPLPDETPREEPVVTPGRAPDGAPGELPDETPRETPEGGPDADRAATPVEEPPPGPDDPAPGPVPEVPPVPETPPADTPAEMPVEEPAEAPLVPPTELPGDAPGEMPDRAPDEAPQPDAPTELPPDTPPGAPDQPVMEATGEVETFYSFTWAPRRREPQGGPRRDRHGDGQGPRRHGGRGSAGATPAGAEGQPTSDRGPRPDRGADRGGQRRGEGPGGRPDVRTEGRKGGARPDRGEGRGEPRGDRPPRPRDERGERGGARTFEARPQKSDRIDPDNPFAAALAGFKAK